MTLEFRASFTKDLRSIRDRSILRRVRETIIFRETPIESHAPNSNGQQEDL